MEYNRHHDHVGGACLTFHHYEKLDRTGPSDYSMDDANRSFFYHYLANGKLHIFEYLILLSMISSFATTFILPLCVKIKAMVVITKGDIISHFRLSNFLYFGGRSVVLLRNPYRFRFSFFFTEYLGQGNPKCV